MIVFISSGNRVISVGSTRPNARITKEGKYGGFPRVMLSLVLE